jgi:membrane-associated phospholipid phosphatase
MAIGVGLSRIYLQQHFIEDVIGGATIGLLAAGLAAGLTWIPKNKA